MSHFSALAVRLRKNTCILDSNASWRKVPDEKSCQGVSKDVGSNGSPLTGREARVYRTSTRIPDMHIWATRGHVVGIEFRAISSIERPTPSVLPAFCECDTRSRRVLLMNCPHRSALYKSSTLAKHLHYQTYLVRWWRVEKVDKLANNFRVELLLVPVVKLVSTT